MNEDRPEAPPLTRRCLLLAGLVTLASLLLPALAWLYNLRRALDEPARDPQSILSWGALASKLEVLLLAAAGAVLGVRAVLRRRRTVESLARAQAEFLEQIPGSWVGAAVFASALLSLLLELVVIRWQGSVFPMFAFYKNYTLLACFAGLGLGYSLAAAKQVPLALSIPLIAWQAALFLLTSHGPPGWTVAAFSATPVLEQMNMGIAVADEVAPYLAAMLLLGVTFLLTAIAFFPIGQLCGRLMDQHPDRLRAYGLNLLGSLAGVLLALGLSYLWTPPITWFALGFMLLLVFQSFDRRVLLLGAISSLAAALVLTWPTSFLWEQTYSPYQLLERGGATPGEGSSVLRAGGHYHQKLTDLSRARVQGPGGGSIQLLADYYELPYKVRGHPGDVAVVGAGTGNDVAAALRMGAESVDAIEIDPAILAYGVAYHPEQPYQDARVRRIVNDARTQLRAADRQYDMVVYGLLDSHTLLSAASNVRLDSFVYTVEAFREARARLRPDGLLSLSFCMLSPELGRKLYLMLEQAFDGRPPICIEAIYDSSVIFLEREGGVAEVDPALLAPAGFRDVTARYANPRLLADVSTDDWPFLYMPRRVYPYSYLAVIGWILLLSLLLVSTLLPARPRPGQLPFFLLGAGFMLIETKSITELGLTFGNTWHVVGLAIAGILAMAFLANWTVLKLGTNRLLAPLALLLLSLVVGYAVAGMGGFPSTSAGRLAAIVLLTCPLFFSGLAFSTLLRRAEATSSAMAANLLGAICGGLLEYNSMYFGFRFLYLVALAIYTLAALAALRGASGRAAAASAPLA